MMMKVIRALGYTCKLRKARGAGAFFYYISVFLTVDATYQVRVSYYYNFAVFFGPPTKSAYLLLSCLC